MCALLSGAWCFFSVTPPRASGLLIAAREERPFVLQLQDFLQLLLPAPDGQMEHMCSDWCPRGHQSAAFIEVVQVLFFSWCHNGHDLHGRWCMSAYPACNYYLTQ